MQKWKHGEERDEQGILTGERIFCRGRVQCQRETRGAKENGEARENGDKRDRLLSGVVESGWWNRGGRPYSVREVMAILGRWRR